MGISQHRIDQLRHETRIVLHITERDLFKRLAALGMVLLLCWHAGAREGVLLIAGIAMLTEAVIRLCQIRLPYRERDLPLRDIAIVWLVNSSSTCAYMAPGVLLAGQPSVPLFLCGFIWVFGIFVHITNTFVALPIYNWSQLIPGFASVAVVMAVARQQGFAAGSPTDWWLAMATIVVYASNTLQTLTMQKDTQQALNAARTEADARLRALEHMTRHDALTGLLTRRAFEEEVGRMLDRRRGSAQVAVILIDLDGFKPINDTYSHDAGDAVLQSIGTRLAALTARDGAAARLGGDEFALAHVATSVDGATHRLAEAALNRIAEPVLWGDTTLLIRGSAGIALSRGGDDTVARLLADADQAMYRAKAETGGQAVLFRPDSFAPRPTRQDRDELCHALETGTIRAFYQPKVDLARGTIVGFEALARWPHPERGLLPATDFVPRIEEFGLQGLFLRQIAAQVFADVETLLAERLDPGMVSLNLPEVALATRSGRQEIERLLSTHPAVKPHLTFEITEDVFIARAGNHIQASIGHFHAMGLRISLDDFGTGFASFQHLRQLDLDELKIHADFVAGLGSDRVAEVLVTGFVSIAQGLGIPVVAEGIETDDQRTALLRMGCTYGQGFLFGPAVPLAEVRQLLERPPPAALHSGNTVTRAEA